MEGVALTCVILVLLLPIANAEGPVYAELPEGDQLIVEPTFEEIFGEIKYSMGNDPSSCDEESCHFNIEEINKLMSPETRCTDCHEGDGDSVEKDRAHLGVIPNPGNMWIVSQGRGCGKCHS
jgi:hypothetical protein